MREILFRGKPKNLKKYKWVQGQLLHHRDNLSVIYSEEADHPVGVMPETVGQFTGLTDKNGKRIFEGDILHIVSDTCDYDFKTSVGAKYGYVSGLYVDGDFDGGDFNEIGFAFDYWSNEDAEVEVIGNIHDNPELLEDAE